MSSAPFEFAIAGSTGSIGTQTLDVVRAEGPGPVSGRGARRRIVAEARRAGEGVPSGGGRGRRRNRAGEVAGALEPLGIEVVADQADVVELADVVINGVVGFAGLPVTITLRRSPARARQQGEPDRRRSCGPAVAGDAGRRADPRRQRALRSPPMPAIGRWARWRGSSSRPAAGRSAAAPPTNWRTSRSPKHSPTRRGRWNKITVDSSTLMNKGLEVIEAHELFGLDYDRIEVVVHPQSVVHRWPSSATDPRSPS